ncbi:MAG: urea ABC transporter permease subunit UrtB [Hyphomicrobiaceae bacterium]
MITRLLLASALLCFVISTPSRAAGLEEALSHFAANKFSSTSIGIKAVAQSGAPHAGALLEALSKRRLYLNREDGLLFYKAADGNLFDALSAKPLANVPEKKKAIRLNNRLRNLIKKMLASMTLVSPDPVKRMAAAKSLFKSQDANALPALQEALARETNEEVRKALDAARAAIIIGTERSVKEQKLAAIAMLSTHTDQDVVGALKVLENATDPEIKQAAHKAIGEIERRLSNIEIAQNVWYGLSLGSVLLLAAIGLAITFGVMGVINMAHGEMVMLGAYTTFVVQEVFRVYAPDAFDLSLPVAIPLAFLVAGSVGIAIERGIIRFLYGRPLETLLATWGVSLILQQSVRTIFGPTNREVGAPSYMSGAFDFFGLSITYGRLWIIVFSLTVFAGLLLLMRLTQLGLQMRAVTQNRSMASGMGIRTGFVDAMTFGLGSGIAGIAGVALSQIDNVSPNLGQSYIIDSFMVVVFGGVGNLWGTLVSAFTLGVANKFLEPFAGAVLGKILILVFLILYIQKHPRGMFALKGRAVES